ncbi:MAG: Fic/DOC family N-terminal domain-containing protein [Parachlamydiales bacterium]|jgi:Fic family protein
MDPTKPFNELPELPPKINLETYNVLKKLIDANKNLAELKGLAALIPNQAILIQVLGLFEAKVSSEIENIVTTNDKLYKAFHDINQNIDSYTKEVLKYQDALWFGFNEIKYKKRLLNTPFFEEIVQVLLDSRSEIRKIPGTKLINSLGEVVYTPPETEKLIRDKLQNLEKFIYSENSLDPLIKLALIHYQFEAIHPFYDGNGRTGRIINILYLVDQKLLDLPILYLSKYIIDHKKDYYQKLRNVSLLEKWEEWILFILDAVISTSIITKNKILSILDLIKKSEELIKNKLPKIFSKELLDLLFKHPYCKIKFLEDAKIAHRQTASLYLKQLEKIGFLKSIKKGKDIYYLNHEFFDLLTKN